MDARNSGRKEGSMKKRTVILGLVGVLLIGAGGWYVSNYGWTAPTAEMLPESIALPWGQTIHLRQGDAESDATVYVSSVASITGDGAVGITDRYTGSVETQETVGVTFDSSKQLKQLMVEEGDEVKKGDPLFSYDTDAMNQKIQEADLELEQMTYELQSLNEQLAQLQAAKAKAKPEELPAYNIQELSGQNDIRRKENEIALKQVARAQLEKSVANAVVLSEIDGIIKTIDKSKTGDGGSGESDYGSSRSSDAYITILKTGDYRIKGTANEMSIWSLQVGQEMLIRPRADESRLYHGTISKIDTEPAKNNSQQYSSSDSGQSVAKYNFYVELTDPMDMMLGQHVLIEPDNGQEEEREGLWLPTYYIVEDEEGSFVWKCSDSGIIEKGRITVGDVDDDLMESQILDGLSETDYIAYPDDSVEEGARAVKPEDTENTDNGVIAE